MMAQMIRIRCNGPNQHVNDIDLEKLLRPATVVRSTLFSKSRSQSSGLPERLVYPCMTCTEGKVVISREIIEEFRRS